MSERALTIFGIGFGIVIPLMAALLILVLS